MKKIQPILIFILAFLFAIEIFLFFNINARLSFIIPVAIIFALVILVISKPTIHLYKMLVDGQYRKHYKSSRRHHSHSKQRDQAKAL